MKLLAFSFVLLAIAASLPHAYTLNVKVTVTQDTPAVGTNISLVSQGVEMAMLKANSSGEARFNVTSGSYFVLLRRYPYPLHVSLVEVRGDSSILLTMRQQVSYSTAYGQISGPANFANASVLAYQSNLVQKRADVNKDGLYVLSYLPEGTYRIVFTCPGFDNYSKEVFLPQSESVEVNAELKKPSEQPPEAPVLSSPAKVPQYSTIEVSLALGNKPLAGARILASTPSGSMALTTDSEGRARLNAAAGGTYRFTYGNLTSTTSVPMVQKPAPPQKPAEPAQNAAQEAQAPSLEQGQPQQSLSPLLLFALFCIAALAAAAAVAFLALRGRKQKRGQQHEAQQRGLPGSGRGAKEGAIQQRRRKK